jgi:hypothetical protein
VSPESTRIISSTVASNPAQTAPLNPSSTTTLAPSNFGTTYRIIMQLQPWSSPSSIELGMVDTIDPRCSSSEQLPALGEIVEHHLSIQMFISTSWSSYLAWAELNWCVSFLKSLHAWQWCLFSFQYSRSKGRLFPHPLHHLRSLRCQLSTSRRLWVFEGLASKAVWQTLLQLIVREPDLNASSSSASEKIARRISLGRFARAESCSRAFARLIYSASELVLEWSNPLGAWRNPTLSGMTNG